MMAWKTLDDSTIDKAEEENQNANETIFENAKNDDLNLFGGEVEVPGDCAGRANLSEIVAECKTKMRMKILMIRH